MSKQLLRSFLDMTLKRGQWGRIPDQNLLQWPPLSVSGVHRTDNIKL